MWRLSSPWSGPSQQVLSSVNEVTPGGEHLSSSGLELATQRLGPLSTVPITPQGAVDGTCRTVVYDCNHTEPNIVRVNYTSLGATNAGSEVMLSSLYISNCSRKRKKYKKRRRCHSSIYSSPGGNLIGQHRLAGNGQKRSLRHICLCSLSIGPLSWCSQGDPCSGLVSTEGGLAS